MASNGKKPTKGDLNQSDVAFVFVCLKHIGNDKFVDLGAVAAALGYTNNASVANRFRAIRKRYGFDNFEGKNSGPAAKAVKKPTSTKDDVIIKVNSSDEDVKPKKKRGAPRKGAKTSSKPTPITEDNGPATGKGEGLSKSKKPKGKLGKHGAALLAAAEGAPEEA